MTVDEVERLRQVLGAFYKTVDVMKSARNSPTHAMNVWADDMKAVEDVMFFLEQLRDGGGDAQAPAWDKNATEAQVNSACMSYRHDFGLMPESDRNQLRFEAREWLHAWQKEGIGCDRNEVIERCAQVVDQANREGPYEAIASAKRIRALKGPVVSSTHAAPRSEDQS